MADTENLSKIDSAVSGVGEGAKAEAGKKRTSSSYPGVMNINDLGELLPAPASSCVDCSLAATRRTPYFKAWALLTPRLH